MDIVFSNNGNIPSGGIFLAGPTRRKSDYSVSWRKEAVNIFANHEYNGIIYIPEYESGMKFISSNENVEKQAHWEWEALDKASVIMFWIPRKIEDMPAFTTNVEFGRYTALCPDKIILGYPDIAQKMRYIELLYNKVCNRQSCVNLEQTIIESIILYNKTISKSNVLVDSTNLVQFTENEFNEFRQDNYCMNCKTSVCDRSFDMMKKYGICGTFKKWLRVKNNKGGDINYDKLSKDE